MWHLIFYENIAQREETVQARMEPKSCSAYVGRCVGDCDVSTFETLGHFCGIVGGVWEILVAQFLCENFSVYHQIFKIKFLIDLIN